jgi:hypothetical protein
MAAARIAMERYQKEQAMLKAVEEKNTRERLAAASALAMAEKEIRLRAMQEREEARLRAERVLAEMEAAAAAAALEREVEAELERLRNRGPLERMMDDMQKMREELDSLKSERARSALIVSPKSYRQFFLNGTWDKRVGSCNLIDSKGNNIFHFNPRPHQELVFISSRKIGEPWEEFDRVPIEKFGLEKNHLLFTLGKEEITVEWAGGQKMSFRLRLDINLMDIRFVKDDVDDKSFYTEL